MLEGPMQSIGRFFGSPAFKLALIAVLVLMLAIPLFSVWALVAERENRSHEVGNEVARSWGGPQAVVGPFLIVPYTTKVRVETGGKQVEQTQDRVAVFMPDTLDIKAKTASQLLHRSIYQVPVYSGELAVAGRFEAPDMGKVTADAIVVHWSEVTLALGLTDVSGLKQASALKIDGRGDLGFEPSVGRGIEHARNPQLAAEFPAHCRERVERGLRRFVGTLRKHLPCQIVPVDGTGFRDLRPQPIALRRQSNDGNGPNNGRHKNHRRPNPSPPRAKEPPHSCLQP